MKYCLLMNNHKNSSSQKKIMIVAKATIVYNVFMTPETKIMTHLLSESYFH
jgi:hypothetical protein